MRNHYMRNQDMPGAVRRPHPVDLLGAFALEACSPGETAAVRAHAAGCASCAAEVDGLVGVAYGIGGTHAAPPPPSLRARVLAAAGAARPAAPAATGTLLDAYTMQVAAFGGLLAALTDEQWYLPSGPYRTVHDLVVHLADSDRLVAAGIGVAPAAAGGRRVRPSEVAGRRWRHQTDGMIRAIAGADRGLLALPVPLAGAPGVRRPLVEAVTQRAFETWIHAEDIRGTLRLPAESPPPEHLDRIVRFGLALLPGAVDAAGRGRPGWVRLELTGPGGGTHAVPLSAAATDDGPAAAEVELSAEGFCRLMAGRTTPAETGVRIRGDERAGADLITVAATLGCD
jgi:uncharacterized protein (TIGR03083 family)